MLFAKFRYCTQIGASPQDQGAQSQSWFSTYFHENFPKIGRRYPTLNGKYYLWLLLTKKGTYVQVTCILREVCLGSLVDVRGGGNRRNKTKRRSSLFEQKDAPSSRKWPEQGEWKSISHFFPKNIPHNILSPFPLYETNIVVSFLMHVWYIMQKEATFYDSVHINVSLLHHTTCSWMIFWSPSNIKDSTHLISTPPFLLVSS